MPRTIQLNDISKIFNLNDRIKHDFYKYILLSRIFTHFQKQNSYISGKSDSWKY